MIFAMYFLQSPVESAYMLVSELYCSSSALTAWTFSLDFPFPLLGSCFLESLWQRIRSGCLCHIYKKLCQMRGIFLVDVTLHNIGSSVFAELDVAAFSLACFHTLILQNARFDPQSSAVVLRPIR